MTLSERIEACIAAERLAAEIPYGLAGLFPTEGRFFKALASSEEEHVAIVIMGRRYDLVGGLPERFAPEMPAIRRSIELAAESREKVNGNDVSLETTLEMGADARGVD